MSDTLLVLNLVLDRLKMSPDINTINDRKRVQKAIYLVQSLGINLGYQFGWYIMGPYSRALAKNYYELSELVALNKIDIKNKTLTQDINKNLDKLIPILKLPKGFELKQEDWLELLASYHYLIKRTDLNGIKEIFRREKPHLLRYLLLAENSLKENGLLN